MRKKSILVLIVIFLLLFSFVLSSAQNQADIVSIWNADVNKDGDLDFENASYVVRMQRRGFERGLDDFAPEGLLITEHILSENDSDTLFTRNLADVYTTYDVLLTVGASSDIQTLYTVKETSFFEIPTLVPFSDCYMGSVNSSGYVMRMTTDSGSYNKFFQSLFGRNFFEMLNGVVFGNGRAPEYSISTAVIFTNNEFGHETAVTVTQELMDDGFDIDVYSSYNSGYMSLAFENSSTDELNNLRNADLVVVIGEYYKELEDLQKILEPIVDPANPPIVIVAGFEPYNENPENRIFDNYYVLRQKQEMNGCPVDIVSRSEAMGYAAGYVVSHVLAEGTSMQGPEKNSITSIFKSEIQKAEDHQVYLNSYRNNIRSSLLDLNDNIPCFGWVDFNVATSADIEMVEYTGLNMARVVDPSEIFYLIADRVSQKTGVSYR